MLGNVPSILRDVRVTRPFDERARDALRLRERHAERIPVICQPLVGHVALRHRKYLIPPKVTAAQFLFIIRRKLNVGNEKALFLFVDETVPSASSTFRELYNTHRNLDGFLYLTYAEENVFGGSTFI